LKIQIQVNRICSRKQRAIGFLLFSVIALLQISLFGCVGFIPAKTEKPRFVDESVSPISPGVTTKDHVKGILGQPDAIRKKDSIYIYSDPRKIGKFLIAMPYPGSPGGTIDYYKNHLIIIQFSNSGIVQELDHVYGRRTRTTKNGIFVAFVNPYNKKVVLYAQPPLDEQAKQFFRPVGKSAIYFYYRKSGTSRLLPDKGLIGHVSLDKISLSDITERGYFYWVVEPGNHKLEISGYSLKSDSHIQPGSLSIDCEEGQIYLVEQTWKTERIFPTSIWSGQMRIVDKDEGQSEIKKRRLILDCFCPFE
jgi:hypothetical protein